MRVCAWNCDTSTFPPIHWYNLRSKRLSGVSFVAIGAQHRRWAQIGFLPTKIHHQPPPTTHLQSHSTRTCTGTNFQVLVFLRTPANQRWLRNIDTSGTNHFAFARVLKTHAIEFVWWLVPFLSTMWQWSSNWWDGDKSRSHRDKHSIVLGVT
jgi:hypothetical protein